MGGRRSRAGEEEERSIVSAVKTAQRLEKARASGAENSYAAEPLRSAQMDYTNLYDSSAIQGGTTVNLMNAPNDSTLQCGCENINCPFCNLMLSISNSDGIQ